MKNEVWLSDIWVKFEWDLSEQHQEIVEQLKKIMVEERTVDGIMIKKLCKQFLKVPTGRVNEASNIWKGRVLQEQAI